MVRWSEEELARYLKHGPVGQISEAAFMQAVLRVARSNNYLAYHTHSSKRSAPGFPDAILAKVDYPILAVEFKTENGQLTKPQEAWLATLAATTGIVTAVWRPSALQEIVEMLRQP